MVDYSVFDSILDAAFVVDSDGRIVYCNDAGATFCQTSVRRVVGKALLSDLLTIAEPGILPFTAESQGRSAPTPFIETEFNVPKAAKTGKLQIAVRPVTAEHWAFFIRDVSLEEALHSKYRSELAQKEDYARNLEKLVEARTAELNLVNQTLKAILNSLGQGFFTFNASGDCGDVFTKACEDILEGSPKNRKAWQVLGVPQTEIEQFKKWSASTFSELLPFDDMKALGPNLFPHSAHRHVTLEYYPIRRAEEAISDLVVVATDKTAEREAQIALEIERQYAAMIVKYTKNKDQFLQFLTSVRKALGGLRASAAKALTGADVNESSRVLHPIEGEAGRFPLRDLRAASRASQQILEPFKGAAVLDGAEREAYAGSLEKMTDEFERFLVDNEDVFRVPEGEVSRSVEIPLDRLTALLKELRSIPAAGALYAKFEEEFMKVTFTASLAYFDSLIQSVAEKLGKKVKPLKIEGGDLRVFPDPYQKLFSSLVHAFRNAVDHGLEMPDDREWGGKDPAGQILVNVSLRGDSIHMTISDDGKGIDPAVIREKLKEKFPGRSFEACGDEEIIQQVCMPGFSSRESVGEFSGRGVGLDALREEVLRIGGAFHIQSTVGQGTKLNLTFPVLGNDPAFLRSA